MKRDDVLRCQEVMETVLKLRGAAILEGACQEEIQVQDSKFQT